VRIATVDAQNRVHYVPITIERDTGATLWVATGVTGDERIVKIAVPSLAEGDLVDVAVAKTAAAGSAAPAAGGGSNQKSSP
jgi:ribosomal protein L12E/L44/L45/RPP1/RPP2